MESWNRCGELQDCRFITRNHDQKYYLRRLSDPDLYGILGYVYPKHCGMINYLYSIDTKDL